MPQAGGADDDRAVARGRDVRGGRSRVRRPHGRRDTGPLAWTVAEARRNIVLRRILRDRRAHQASMRPTSNMNAAAQVPEAADDGEAQRRRSYAENWDRLAKFDAMWAVLSDASKIGGKWDPAEFFATGKDVLARLDALEARGVHIANGVAVDFGCGLGRVSHWLAQRFARVVGVDISSHMVELAERYNATRTNPITFVVGNERNIPLATSSADYIYSFIALQHIPKALQQMYVKEFARIVRPGGYVNFQTPSHAVDGGPGGFAFDLPTGSGPATVEMHSYPRAEVESLLESCGCRIVDVADDQSCGSAIKSYFYLAQRQI